MAQSEPGRLTVRRYWDPDRAGLEAVLLALGWDGRFVRGQIVAADQLRVVPNGTVLVADGANGERGERLVGYVSAQLHSWNRLGQLQGLAVHPSRRREGVATALVDAAERWVRTAGGRGVYVDTPVDNSTGRAFYETRGYQLAYVMPRYYADGLDGVTYVRFFT